MSSSVAQLTTSQNFKSFASISGSKFPFSSLGTRFKTQMSDQAQLAFSFPPPIDEAVDVLVVAGEHSGDEHAARMVAAAIEKNPNLRVSALGGRHLDKAGAQLLFDLTQFSVVGFFEVLKHYGEFKKLFEEILRWIREYKPKIVCFVDYPGFNLRLANKLVEEGIAAKSGGDTRLLYYISPQVWAWKKKRKYKMARMLDSLAVIFPFEVVVFSDTDLETRFVGHPFLSADYKLPVSYDPDGPILLLPGSRKAAIERIAPAMLESFQECLQRKGKLRAVCIYANDELRQTLQTIVDRYPVAKKHLEYRSNSEHVGARAVITSSGTMSLNCALAGIPGTVAYKTHPMTYIMGRMLVKIKYIGIANLLLNKVLYPEYLQGRANAAKLSKELIDCIENAERIKAARHGSAKLVELLDQPRNGGAADWLLEHL